MHLGALHLEPSIFKVKEKPASKPSGPGQEGGLYAGRGIILFVWHLANGIISPFHMLIANAYFFLYCPLLSLAGSDSNGMLLLMSLRSQCGRHLIGSCRLNKNWFNKHFRIPCQDQAF